MQVEVIIVGGSFAGISAATQLARGRRRVLVIDGGLRRNRFAHAAHGFLGQDGRDPADIQAEGRRQLLLYPSVTWIDGTVTAAAPAERGFRVQTGDGETHEAKRLVVATGVKDELPNIAGLAERWGKSVFFCPYCDGYELGQQPAGVLATRPNAFHQAMMLPDWGPTTFFTNGIVTLDAEQQAELARRGTTIEPRRVVRISGERADLELENGSRVALAGIFIPPRTSMASPVAEMLGCAFEDGPAGPIIATGPTKETSVAGVFACGDAARAMASVALAVADGVMAGSAAHQSLIFRPD
jgi:thioredoxin reductase